MKEGSLKQRNIIERVLTVNDIEFRRGLSGGGNQTLHPHIKNNFNINQDEFPNVTSAARADGRRTEFDYIYIYIYT